MLITHDLGVVQEVLFPGRLFYCSGQVIGEGAGGGLFEKNPAIPTPRGC